MLETLLKPVKFVDEGIHRKYEKLGKRLDEKSPKARYHTAAGFGFIGIPLFCTFTSIFPFTSLIGGFDLSQNIRGILGELPNQKDISEIKMKDSPLSELITGTIKLVRSPLFLTGIGFTGKGVYNLVSSFFNNELPLTDTYLELSQGLGMISLSSSMYLRDKEPKLLDKEPFWKRAYNLGKEKINSLVPKPILQPILIKTDSGLEDYVKE